VAFPPPLDLTGSGVITLGKPRALISQIVTNGLGMRTGRSNPPTTFDVGFIVPGDVNGWYPAIPIAQANQVIPMPPNITRLGYAMYRGSEITVDEINTGYSFGLDITDRNPLPMVLGDEAWPPTVGATTQDWNYTVPANRVFQMQSVRVGGNVTAVWTTGSISIWIGTTIGAHILDHILPPNTPVGRSFEYLHGLTLPLRASDAINGWYDVPTGIATGTGGIQYVETIVIGVEFDA
jgi:hypothetical protein